MTKNKIIHTRIDEELHKRIFEKCNSMGCTFSDFIIDCIENNLKVKPETNEMSLEPVSETTELTKIPKIIVTRYSPDGQTWIDLPQK